MLNVEISNIAHEFASKSAVMRDIESAIAQALAHFEKTRYQPLREENARLRTALDKEPDKKDADRLDWLDRVNAGANKRNGTKYGWKFDINHNRAALTDCNCPALSVREAIDKAMRG